MIQPLVERGSGRQKVLPARSVRELRPLSARTMI